MQLKRGSTPIDAINFFKLRVVENDFHFQAVIWKSPPIHWVTLNEDRASEGNLGEAGSGVSP